jgi:type II secretory pathway component PulL
MPNPYQQRPAIPTAGTPVCSAPEDSRLAPAVNQPPSMASARQNADYESLSGALQSMESMMKGMRALLVVNLLTIAALLGWIFLLNQQLSKNSEEVRALRGQAQGAVSQFMPSLDSRLNIFEQRMDGLDQKLKNAQDQMVSSLDAKMKSGEDQMEERMNKEIPAMLDKYISRKLGELKR